MGVVKPLARSPTPKGSREERLAACLAETDPERVPPTSQRELPRKAREHI